MKEESPPYETEFPKTCMSNEYKGFTWINKKIIQIEQFAKSKATIYNINEKWLFVCLFGVIWEVAYFVSVKCGLNYWLQNHISSLGYFSRATNFFFIAFFVNFLNFTLMKFNDFRSLIC